MPARAANTPGSPPQEVKTLNNSRYVDDPRLGSPTVRTPPLPVEIIEWRPVRKNSLLGFVTVRLGKNLLFHDAPLMRSGGRQWVAMPSKPRLNRDGTPLLGQNGKPLWQPIVSWGDKEAADRFSQSVLDALILQHPEALDGDDGYEGR